MKLPFFKMKDAIDETKDSFSYGSGTDKVTSSAKLLGKTIANVGMFAVAAGSEIIKRLPEEAGKQAQKRLNDKSELRTEEQNEKLQKVVDNGKEAERKRIERERMERENSDRN